MNTKFPVQGGSSHRKLFVSLLLCWLSLVGVLILLASTLPAQAGGVVSVCDEAHLRAALVGGGSVSFNCGPTSQITLTSQIVVTANTSIDGANGGTPVILSGP